MPTNDKVCCSNCANLKASKNQKAPFLCTQGNNAVVNIGLLDCFHCMSYRKDGNPSEYEHGSIQDTIESVRKLSTALEDMRTDASAYILFPPGIAKVLRVCATLMEHFLKVRRSLCALLDKQNVKIRKALESAREKVNRIKEPYDGVTYDENGYAVGGTPVDVVDADDVMEILSEIERAISGTATNQ